MKKRMILLDILLCILMTFTITCMTIKPIVVKTISTDISGVAISHQLMDYVYKEFPNASTNDMLMVQNKLTQSKAVEKLTKSYIDQIIKNRKHPKSLHTNEKDIARLFDEATSIVEEHIGVNVTTVSKQSLQNMMNEHKNSMISQLESTISYFGSIASSDQFTFLFQLYAILTSLWFQFICILTTIACAYALIHKSSFEKALFHFSVCFIIVGICLYVVLPNMSDSILATLSNHILGRTIFFNFTPMNTAGIITLVLAVIFGIIGMLFHHKEINTQESIHLA